MSSLLDPSNPKYTLSLSKASADQTYFLFAALGTIMGMKAIFRTKSTTPLRNRHFRIGKPSDNEAPWILNGPHLKAIDKDSAVIAWETDEPASSMLQYGLSKAEWGGFDHSKVIMDMRTDHSVTIKVGSMDVSGNNYETLENDDNPSKELTFQLGSGSNGNINATQAADSVSHSASEVSGFISATGK